jgi:hypothetical protein
MNSDRAAEARNTAIPLGGLHLGSLTVVLKSEGDTVARVTARIQEVRGGKLRFAPLEFVFLEAEGRWQLASVKGALVGLCGLAQR